MNDAPQDDLTMAGHARSIARQARTLEMETGEPSNPFRPGSVTDLNAIVCQLADIVAELAKQQEAAQRRLTAGCGDRGGECGQLDGSGVAGLKVCDAVIEDPMLRQPDREYRCTLHDGHEGYHDDGWGCSWGEVQASTTPDCASLIPSPSQTAADPLDEDDHRPRHNRYGGHVYRHGPEHWHDYRLEDGRCDMEPAMDDPVRLADFPGPLTFCDCDHRPRREAENGATD